MEKQPVAVYTMSNTMGVLIYEVNSDAVLAEFSDESGAQWCEIDYVIDPDSDDEEFQAVFKLQGHTIPLKQCMRVN